MPRISTEYPRFFSALTQKLSSDLQVVFRDLVRNLEKLQITHANGINDNYGDELWTDVSSFSNSWVNYAGAFANAGYKKSAGDTVSLRGLIKSGTVGAKAFTLPVNYRPSTSVSFSVDSNAAFGKVVIQSNGDVIPSTPSSNTYVSLDGIIFSVLP